VRKERNGRIRRDPLPPHAGDDKRKFAREIGGIGSLHSRAVLAGEMVAKV
jgi:hypothetical protein